MKQKRTPLEVGPNMTAPEPPEPRRYERAARKDKPGWCKFKTKGRCYVESALLENAEQEITLSPAGSYRQQENENLILIEGEIPTLPEDAPQHPGTGPSRPSRMASPEEKKAYADYNDRLKSYENFMADYLQDLDDGDPKVGPATGEFKLVKQG